MSIDRVEQKKGGEWVDKILTPEEVSMLSKDEKEQLIAYHQE